MTNEDLQYYKNTASVTKKLDIKLKEYFSNEMNSDYLIETRIISFGDTTQFGKYSINPERCLIKEVVLSHNETEMVDRLYAAIVRGVNFKVQELISVSGFSGKIKDFKRVIKVVYDTVIFHPNNELEYMVGVGIVPSGVN